MSPLESFNQHRSLLFGIAYRMLGSAMDAEDMVQEAFLRWQQATPADDVQSPKAFLTTIITRLCLDHLGAARVQREQYVGPWLPEPLLMAANPDQMEAQTLSDSLSTAFLLLLENLSPLERAIFLLREVFDYEYAEIAQIVAKSEANCRQLFARAKQHLKEKRPRFNSSRAQHEQVMSAFMQACATGDLQGLMNMLSADVVSYSDGGGKQRAALRPVCGPEHVARLVLGLMRKATADMTMQVAEVNGRPAILVYLQGHLSQVTTLDILDGQVQGLYSVLNPDKLKDLERRLTNHSP